MNLLVVTLLHWSLTDQICTLEGCLRHCILAHGTSVGMSSSPALVPRDLLAVWPGDGPAVRGLLHLAAEGVGHPRPGLGLGLVVPGHHIRNRSFHWVS